jgi:hypothetical protein
LAVIKIGKRIGPRFAVQPSGQRALSSVMTGCSSLLNSSAMRPDT